MGKFQRREHLQDPAADGKIITLCKPDSVGS
jgi:hypothetical protein